MENKEFIINCIVCKKDFKIKLKTLPSVGDLYCCDTCVPGANKIMKQLNE